MHRQQKFPCPECDYEATQKGTLATHLKFEFKHKKYNVTTTHMNEFEYEHK